MHEEHMLKYTPKSFGSSGWLPEGATHSNLNSNSSGFMVAHDLIEHQNGGAELGSIKDELEAFGAIWFTRCERGNLFNEQGVFVNEIITYYIDNLHYLWKQYNSGAQPLPAATCLQAFPPLDGTIREAVESMKHEHMWDEPEHKVEWFEHCAYHYMHMGYTKAKNRFGTSKAASETFWALTYAFDRFIADTPVESLSRTDLHVVIYNREVFIYLGKQREAPAKPNPYTYRRFQKGS